MISAGLGFSLTLAAKPRICLERPCLRPLHWLTVPSVQSPRHKAVSKSLNETYTQKAEVLLAQGTSRILEKRGARDRYHQVNLYDECCSGERRGLGARMMMPPSRHERRRFDKSRVQCCQHKHRRYRSIAARNWKVQTLFIL